MFDELKNALRGLVVEKSNTLRKYLGEATDDWDESKHPRGNANNAGQFAKKSNVISEKEEVTYQNAVSNGDMETAHRILRDVAAKMMPETKVLGEDGLPAIVFHGTMGHEWELFSEFSRGMFSDNRDVAKHFDGSKLDSPGKIYACFLDIRNPFVIDANGGLWKEIPVDKNVAQSLGIKSSEHVHPRKKDLFKDKYVFATTNEIVDAVRRNGSYDGVILKNVVEADSEDVFSPNDIVPFHPEQVKMASVEYDDDGNLIPLAKRFSRSSDMRGAL